MNFLMQIFDSKIFSAGSFKVCVYWPFREFYILISILQYCSIKGGGIPYTASGAQERLELEKKRKIKNKFGGYMFSNSTTWKK